MIYPIISVPIEDLESYVDGRHQRQSPRHLPQEPGEERLHEQVGVGGVPDQQPHQISQGQGGVHELSERSPPHVVHDEGLRLRAEGRRHHLRQGEPCC